MESARSMKSWRIFTRQDTRRICNFLIILCLMLSIYALSNIKSHYCQAPYGKLQAPLKLEQPSKVVANQLREESRGSSAIDELFAEDEDAEENSAAISSQKPICRDSNKRSDTCDARGDIRVQGSSSTVFVSTSPQEWKIKPYARKGYHSALRHVTEWSLKPFAQQIPNCTVAQMVPAVIFSIAGFTGNIFHDFTDVLIPLFISSHQFNGQVQFLVADVKPWWLSRYKLILKQMSSYEIIHVLRDGGDMIRCFPRAIIGLQFHKEMGVDSTNSPTGYSIVDFKVMLRRAYGLERADISSSVFQGSVRKPRLLIISRKRSRSFVQVKGMVEMATSLGFEVLVDEADVNTDLSKFARLVNSADVLLGVHGAGLTNMLFLPAGAVVIQMAPFGAPEWLQRETFGKATEDLELHYLEYRIEMEESTLMDQYPRDHPVLKDPESVQKLGWNEFWQVYLEKQNVRPHLGKLKETFLKAMKLLPRNGNSGI
ncbi:protein O-linked-mannose beta-1,4-N-acetylglucosaminyltransferase 2-like [Phalaenopsis equestris]|uniref:protein O-linked-mannose beta-1,4-N-acetylglucosaminyltransferase 2-like n=1 Tax=Phalaenopsis equestris TaxID=78828 RepID=UPI0009E47750|nr:protein O-linked-mannose beta-1,4-N-acetylglucosaminyltransferase 2-like [Phalaenopsis equestris]